MDSAQCRPRPHVSTLANRLSPRVAKNPIIRIGLFRRPLTRKDHSANNARRLSVYGARATPFSVMMAVM